MTVCLAGRFAFLAGYGADPSPSMLLADPLIERLTKNGRIPTLHFASKIGAQPCDAADRFTAGSRPLFRDR